MPGTQATNRANGILTAYGFTVFRLVPINSPTGFRILQAVLDHRTPAEIATLHRNRAKHSETEKCAWVDLPDYLCAYLQEVLQDVRQLNQRIQAHEALLLSMIETCQLSAQVERL